MFIMYNIFLLKVIITSMKTHFIIELNMFRNAILHIKKFRLKKMLFSN